MSDPIDAARERGYIDGKNAALRALLEHVASEMRLAPGDTDSVDALARRLAIAEAQLSATRAALRELCRDFGDGDWSDDLHLADVVDKHLGRHLYG